MDRFETDVLEELCRARVTTSSVGLASDLVDRGRLSEYGDPFGLVVMTLEALGASGMVTYRLGEHEVPVDIRPTTQGAEAVGYRTRYIRAGAHEYLRTDAERSPDPTHFQSLRRRTDGGPCEKMYLGAHIIVYPDHPEHDRQLAEVRAARVTRERSIR